MATDDMDVKLYWGSFSRFVTVDPKTASRAGTLMAAVWDAATTFFHTVAEPYQAHGGFVIVGPTRHDRNKTHVYTHEDDYRAVKQDTQLMVMPKTARPVTGLHHEELSTANEEPVNPPSSTSPGGPGGQLEPRLPFFGKKRTSGLQPKNIASTVQPPTSTFTSASGCDNVGNGPPAETMEEDDTELPIGWKRRETGTRKTGSKRGAKEMLTIDFQVPDFPKEIVKVLEMKGAPLTSAQKKVVVNTLYNAMALVVEKDMRPHEEEYTRVLGAFFKKYGRVLEAQDVQLPEGVELRRRQCPWKLALLRKFKYHRNRDQRNFTKAKKEQQKRLGTAPGRAEKASRLTEQEKKTAPLRKKKRLPKLVGESIITPYTKTLPKLKVDEICKKLEGELDCMERADLWNQTTRPRRFECMEAKTWGIALKRWPSLGSAKQLFAEVQLQTGVQISDHALLDFIERPGARHNAVMMIWDLVHRKGPSAAAAMSTRTRISHLPGDPLSNWLLCCIPLFLNEAHADGWLWYSSFNGTTGSPVVAPHMGEDGELSSDRFDAFIGGEKVCPLDEDGLSLEDAFKAVVSACYIGNFRFGNLCPVAYQIVSELIFKLPVDMRDVHGDRYARFAYRLLSSVELPDHEYEERMHKLEEKVGLANDEETKHYESADDSCTEEQQMLITEQRRERRNELRRARRRRQKMIEEGVSMIEEGVSEPLVECSVEEWSDLLGNADDGGDQAQSSVKRRRRDLSEKKNPELAVNVVDCGSPVSNIHDESLDLMGDNNWAANATVRPGRSPQFGEAVESDDSRADDEAETETTVNTSSDSMESSSVSMAHPILATQTPASCELEAAIIHHSTPHQDRRSAPHEEALPPTQLPENAPTEVEPAVIQNSPPHQHSRQKSLDVPAKENLWNATPSRPHDHVSAAPLNIMSQAKVNDDTGARFNLGEIFNKDKVKQLNQQLNERFSNKLTPINNAQSPERKKSEKPPKQSDSAQPLSQAVSHALLTLSGGNVGPGPEGQSVPGHRFRLRSSQQSAPTVKEYNTRSRVHSNFKHPATVKKNHMMAEILKQ